MKKTPFPIVLSAVIFVSVIVCVLLYHYDNKYIYSQPQAIRGILALQENETDRFVTLVSGWEFYQYKTLTPKEIHDHQPDAYIFIGQYSGFEMGDSAASPYGEATYRYCIDTGTGQAKRYMLYMPEVYTSYTLWINGEMMDISQNATSIFPVSFVAADTIEIIINASNYTHYYSGLIYPPLFGSVLAITSLIFTRAIIFSAVMIFAVVVGVFALASGKYFEKRTISIGGFALCLFYTGSISYVVIHSIGLPMTEFWYALEDVCYFAALAMAGFLCTVIANQLKKLGLVALLCGGLICLLRIALTWLMLESSKLYLYSLFLDAYKTGIAVLIVAACVIRVIKKDIRSKTLLSATVAYAVFLVAEVITDPGYEPIWSARFSELGGFVFVCIFGLIVLLETIRSYKERLEHEKRIIEQGKQLAQKELELTNTRVDVMLSQIQPHFLYNTLTTIENMVHKDADKASKMIISFSGYLRENMDSLAQKELIPFERELKHVKVYLDFEKIRFKDDLNIVYDCEVTSFYLPILTVQPIVENAVRHGVMKNPEGGTVSIATRRAQDNVEIIISDDGSGFDPSWSADDGRSHIGLKNVKSRLMAQCGGTLAIESQPDIGTTVVITIPAERRTADENNHSR